MNIITKIRLASTSRLFGSSRIVVERKLKYKKGSINLENWKGEPFKLRAYNKVQWSKVRPQLNPPTNDIINFKKMSGNEILINLQHSQYLRRPELLGGLIALGKIKRQEEHDWNSHPWTENAFSMLKTQLGQMNRRDLVQTARALDQLRMNDPQFWGKIAIHILRIMHELRSTDYYLLLDIFHRPLDQKEEEEDIVLALPSGKEQNQEKKTEIAELSENLPEAPVSWKGREMSVKILGVQNLRLTFGGTNNQRVGPQFFQRLIAMLPVHLKNLSASEITRLHQICTERNIGSQQLYEQFFYFYMEKYSEKFSNQDYLSNLKSMARRSYQHDQDFWDTIYLPVIYERAYNERDASDLRDGLIFLKLSCPFVVVKNVMQYLDEILEKFENIKGYQDLSDAEKDQIKLRGSVPDTEKARIRKRVLLKEMANKLDNNTNQTIPVDGDEREQGTDEESSGEREQKEAERKEKREEKKLKIKLRRAKVKND